MTSSNNPHTHLTAFVLKKKKKTVNKINAKFLNLIQEIKTSITQI